MVDEAGPSFSEEQMKKGPGSMRREVKKSEAQDPGLCLKDIRVPGELRGKDGKWSRNGRNS